MNTVTLNILGRVIDVMRVIDATGAANTLASKFSGIALALAIVLIPLGTIGLVTGGLCLTAPSPEAHRLGWKVLGSAIIGIIIGGLAAPLALMFQ